MGNLELTSPRVLMTDWRSEEELPTRLKGKAGTIDISKIANGDIEITSPFGEKSMLALEFDTGVPRIHIYPPEQEKPKEQCSDEVAVTVALLPGHVLTHDPHGNGYAMSAESQYPTAAPYFDGDARIEEMHKQESDELLKPKQGHNKSPSL